MAYIFWTATPIIVALAVLTLFLWKKNKALKKKLAQEVLEKQQILSIVSHDIRSPFNRISALEQLLTLDDNPLSERQSDYIDRIHLVVADGLGLVRNLVDYRNLEYRKTELLLEDIDVSVLVHHIAQRYRSLAERKQLSLHADIQEHIQIHSDQQFISRGIENTLSNAVKFSPPDTTIYLQLTQSEQKIIITISDKGPGFEPGEKDLLFQKFQKLSAKPTAGESTTGLGLYISQTMLKAIGGSIAYEAPKEQGSKFIITIPVTQQP